MSYEAEQAAVQREVRKTVLIALGVLLALTALFLVGCPKYKVYRADHAGQASLKEAENAKLVEIEEAKAHLESERLNAQSEVVRAEGAAEAIQTEAGELTEKYIQYLWVRQQSGDAETVYIPTEAGLPLLEANRRTP